MTLKIIHKSGNNKIIFAFCIIFKKLLAFFFIYDRISEKMFEIIFKINFILRC